MVAKRLADLPVQAGIYTEQTARGAVGYWKRGDKVRFRKGLPEKIGGWDRIENQFLGLARRLWDWTSLDARSWVSLGTESKLYLWQGGTLFDITPLRRSISLLNAINTTVGSSVVVIDDVAHGAQSGDYMRISGASPVGGIIIDGQYQLTVIDSNSYSIVDDQVAGSTANGGGSVQIAYDISVGLSNTSFGTGWNTGTYSQETWNTPRTISQTVTSLRTWSLDNWGEDLIACPRGGGIYWWDRSNGPSARGTILGNAPENVNYAIISQRDRHLFALGCTDEFTGLFDPLLIRWCSKEDFDDWTPTSTNTSGDLRLYRGSKIEAAIRTRGEILVFTNVSVHQINYLGGNAVYGVQTVGENVSILGPNAGIEVDYRVFFMAESDFYVYDGILRVLECDVRNFVYENLNNFQKDKVFAGLNREFNEIWFFYPAKDENVWIETDFTAGNASNLYRVQSMASAQRYSVQFNAAGYIEGNPVESSGVYDSVYYLQTGAQVLDPADADYEVSFILGDVSPLTTRHGIMFEITDLAGTADTDDDNLQGLSVTVQADTNAMYFEKRTAAGTRATLANAAASYSLSGLATPITLTAGNAYSLIAKRQDDSVFGYIYDEASDTTQLVATVALDAGEITAYPGSARRSGPLFGTKGLATQETSAVLVNAYRVAPGDILVATTTRGASSEVNRYAIYNYQENTWAIGSMVRTAWADRSPVFNKPYAAGDSSYLYQHEVGSDDDGAALPSFIESYDMEIPEAGEYLMHVDKLIPDFLDLDGTVNITLKGKKYPQVQTYQVKGPYPVTPLTRKVSTRIRARQIALRIETNQVGDKWRMGTLRARLYPHGKRA